MRLAIYLNAATIVLLAIHFLIDNSVHLWVALLPSLVWGTGLFVGFFIFGLLVYLTEDHKETKMRFEAIKKTGEAARKQKESKFEERMKEKQNGEGKGD